MAGRALTDIDWDRLTRREAGSGLYAVVTTGVVCRCGCLARTPLRRNALAFDTLSAALAAGFRPCKRCRPDAPGR